MPFIAGKDKQQIMQAAALCDLPCLRLIESWLMEDGYHKQQNRKGKIDKGIQLSLSISVDADRFCTFHHHKYLIN